MKVNELKDRQIHEDGTVICHQSALIKLLYEGQSLDGIFCSNPEDEREWMIAKRLCDDGLDGPTHAEGPRLGDIDWYAEWFTPEPYANIDLLSWCLDRCVHQEEIDRVLLEIREMEKRNMIPIMRHLIYCVDTWRANGVFWGVGRGSSVCSFVLHLIGINRINPLLYDLDINEWLK